MKLELRKFTKFVDKTFIEGGKEAKEPVLLVSVAAVFKNPWDGKGFVEDLKPTILDLAPKLGDILVPELIKERILEIKLLTFLSINILKPQVNIVKDNKININPIDCRKKSEIILP